MNAIMNNDQNNARQAESRPETNNTFETAQMSRSTSFTPYDLSPNRSNNLQRLNRNPKVPEETPPETTVNCLDNHRTNLDVGVTLYLNKNSLNPNTLSLSIPLTGPKRAMLQLLNAGTEKYK